MFTIKVGCGLSKNGTVVTEEHKLSVTVNLTLLEPVVSHTVLCGPITFPPGVATPKLKSQT
jgi:hypothetical protein